MNKKTKKQKKILQKKILIIEDDSMISSMYKIKLEQAGFFVVIAENGVEGIKLTISQKPNLILLDVMLPQMDGFAVLQKIKTDKKTKKIPVIMLTNLGTTEDMKKGMDLGADEYLVKANLTPNQISDEINKILK